MPTLLNTVTITGISKTNPNDNIIVFIRDIYFSIEIIPVALTCAFIVEKLFITNGNITNMQNAIPI